MDTITFGNRRVCRGDFERCFVLRASKSPTLNTVDPVSFVSTTIRKKSLCFRLITLSLIRKEFSSILLCLSWKHPFHWKVEKSVEYKVVVSGQTRRGDKSR